jgi:hypothetical protein
VDLRYLKKILTGVEIEIVQKAADPDLTLWSFWVCKETAYKVLKKFSAGIVFRPRCWSVKFNRPDDRPVTGEVVIPGEKSIFVRTCFSDDYVHCIGAGELFALDKIIWDVDILPQAGAGTDVDPSAFARDRLLRRLADTYSLNIVGMDIGRDKQGRELQPPYLYLDGKKAAFDISLSHDGKFVACAFIRQFD